METRAHHVIIGLFTLLAGAGAVLFAVWISNANTSSDYRYYTVVFREAVTGLSRGSAVQYRGIPIGDITELGLDPEDPSQVLAGIRISGTAPITRDTKARLTFTGITGNTVIELVPGDPNSPLLDGDGTQAARIPATPSPISSLLANGEDLMTNINQLVSRSEEHTSELQSRPHLVCRLLLEKKKKTEDVKISHGDSRYCNEPIGLRHCMEYRRGVNWCVQP